MPIFARRTPRRVGAICTVLLLLLLPLTLTGCHEPSEACYTISYEPDGGTLPAQLPLTHNGRDPLDLPIPSKLGYEFCGWILNGSQIVYSLPAHTAQNVFLKATWKLLPLSLPIMKITLSDGVLLSQLNKTDYKKALVSIENSNDYHLDNAELEIRGRGNASWMSEKKSFKLKFSQKQDLFGLMDGGTSKHWVIVGNYRDNSLSKNNLAYTLANKVFDNISYTTAYQNIELYVNGEYRGVYSIYESTRVEKDRVNIQSSPLTVDTGFLLEYDMLATGKDGWDYFYVNGLRYPLRVDTPSPDDLTDEAIYREQVAFIYRYMQDVVNAIQDKDFQKVCSLVDMDSVIDVYLMHELFKNADVGLSSFYMYKEAGGKLFFGPIWDFDKSCMDCIYGGETEGLFASVNFHQDQMVLKASNPFFYLLMEQEAFVQMVKARWAEVYPNVLETVDTFINDTMKHTQAFKRNFSLWPEYGILPVEESLTQLGRWLRDRAIWLTEYNWSIQADIPS